MKPDQLPEPAAQRTILLAEDNIPSAEVIAEIIADLGYQVIVAADGAAAVALARQHRPGLILMDMQMPVMDGLAATRVLKADPLTAAIPIIFLTAFSTEKDVAICLEAGAVRHLSKPMEYDKLGEILAQYYS
jgi:CheY-like chemotaxis protein